ncbi:hypothetical protein EMPG_11142, partial [Blastomyces silverae]
IDYEITVRISIFLLQNALISSELTVKIENALTFTRNISSVRETSVRETSVRETLVRDFSETEDLSINSKITGLLISKNLMCVKTFSE